LELVIGVMTRGKKGKERRNRKKGAGFREDDENMLF
jgi:hypothetical protein